MSRLADLLLVQSSLVDTARPTIYRVIAEIKVGKAARPERVAVVMTTGAAANSPYQILDWLE
jgi:hypothetical protein